MKMLRVGSWQPRESELLSHLFYRCSRNAADVLFLICTGDVSLGVILDMMYHP